MLRDWGELLRKAGRRDEGDEKLRQAVALFDEHGHQARGERGARGAGSRLGANCRRHGVRSAGWSYARLRPFIFEIDAVGRTRPRNWSQLPVIVRGRRASGSACSAVIRSTTSSYMQITAAQGSPKDLQAARMTLGTAPGEQICRFRSERMTTQVPERCHVKATARAERMTARALSGHNDPDVSAVTVGQRHHAGADDNGDAHPCQQRRPDEPEVADRQRVAQPERPAPDRRRRPGSRRVATKDDAESPAGRG